MAFTPYHFGPSGFIGLAFRKYIDIIVFMLANVLVDIEVLVVILLRHGRPYHHYLHTLLVGAILGIAGGIGMYPLRHLFKRIMQIIRLPYETSLRKMIISGVLGVWFHVLIDTVCHDETKLFWPCRTNPLGWLATEKQMEVIGTIFILATAVLYVTVSASYTKQTKAAKTAQKTK